MMMLISWGGAAVKDGLPIMAILSTVVFGSTIPNRYLSISDVMASNIRIIFRLRCHDHINLSSKLISKHLPDFSWDSCARASCYITSLRIKPHPTHGDVHVCHLQPRFGSTLGASYPSLMVELPYRAYGHALTGSRRHCRWRLISTAFDRPWFPLW